MIDLPGLLPCAGACVFGEAGAPIQSIPTSVKIARVTRRPTDSSQPMPSPNLLTPVEASFPTTAGSVRDARATSCTAACLSVWRQSRASSSAGLSVVLNMSLPHRPLAPPHLHTSGEAVVGPRLPAVHKTGSGDRDDSRRSHPPRCTRRLRPLSMATSGDCELAIDRPSGVVRKPHLTGRHLEQRHLVARERKTMAAVDIATGQPLASALTSNPADIYILPVLQHIAVRV